MTESPDSDRPPRDTAPEGLIARRPLLVAMAVNGLVYALFFLVFTPGFEGPDDVWLMEWASGRYSGQPSPFLHYTNVILGAALNAAYGAAPSLPWYPAYLFAAHILAWTLILHGLLALRRDPWAFAVYAAGFAVFELPIAVKFHYTSTGMLLSAAAAFHFCATNLKTFSWSSTALASAGLIFAGLIRAQTLHAALVFSFPLLLAFALIKRRIARDLLVALAVLGLHGATIAVNLAAYKRAPDWQYFYDFERQIWNVAGRPRPALLEDHELADFGWTWNDLELAYTFNYMDASVFRLDSVRGLSRLLKTRRPKLKPKRLRKEVRRELYDYYRLELGFVLGFALIFLPVLDRRRLAGLAFVGLWHFAIIVFIYQYYERMPNRVIRPTLVVPWLATLIITGLPELRTPAWLARPTALWMLRWPFGHLALQLRLSPRFRALWAGWIRWTPVVLMPALLAACIAPQVWYGLAHSRIHRQNQADYRRDLRRLRAVDPDGVFVMWGAAGFYRVDPFADPAELPPVKTIDISWTAQSPQFYNKLELYEIDNISKAIAERKDLYLVADKLLIGRYKNFMDEHYQTEIKACAVGFIERCFIDLKRQGHSARTCQCVLKIYRIETAK